MGLVNEEYNEYYDKILDLFSEVGLDGLSKDEIDYLKSGGQTDLPIRFKSQQSQEKYDEFVKGNNSTELTTSDWQDIFDLQKIIDKSPTQVCVINNFDGVGFYLDLLCSLIFPVDDEIIENLKKLNHYSSELSEIKKSQYYYAIPKNYMEHLNGVKIKKLPPKLNKPNLNNNMNLQENISRIEKLLGDYITMSYPTAKKFRLAPPSVNGSITTFTLPDPQDERDNLIFKFDVFGKSEYNINPEFLNSIKSLFGEKKNLKKLILKWFEEKEVDEDLIQNSDTHKEEQNESINDIQGIPLYHHTTESRALSIMNSDMMRGTKPDDDILDVDQTLADTKHQSMVSFTRDKNFMPNSSIGASTGGVGDINKLKVIFVVDKDKLKSNYKVVPFDYSSLEDRWYDKRMKDEPDTIIQPRTIRKSKGNEYEERVLTNKIEPLKRYIIDIIYKGDNPLVQEKINEYLNRDRQKEPMDEGLHDTSWENDEGDKVTLMDLLNATEEIPVSKVDFEDLKPHLLTWNDDEEERKKIDKADLQYPILIFVEDDGSFISIIDGHHRAQKAVKNKLETIKAKVIPMNSLPKNIKKVFGHMGKKETK